MKRTYVWRDGKMVETTSDRVLELHYVQPDLAEFKSNSGARISGRRQWREHLKRTGAVEGGFADIRKSQESWEKRRAKFAERVAKQDRFVRPAEAPEGEIRPIEMSRVNAEVRNRLEGRPAPDRKTLVKITLETARAIARRT